MGAAQRVEPFRPRFLDCFEGVESRGIETWRAVCPMCSSADRRFTISAGDRQWVANCYGGNREHVRAALAEVGLRFDDLLYEAEARSVCVTPVRGPHSSPLNPLATFGEGEPEVEQMLRAHAAGTLSPEPVILPALPPGASGPMRAVAALFELVYGLRLAGCDERPVPFGQEWAAGRLGIPARTVGRVLTRLVECGALERGPDMPARPPRRGTHTYLPGRGGAELRVLRGGAA